MTRFLAAVFIIALWLLCGAAARADTRIALLIGNAHYAAAPALANPPNDVATMANAFRAAGFDSVETRLDLDRAGMVKALRAFQDEAAGADVAVIYFSGHGLEIGGENYLLPTDATLASDRDAEDEAVTLDRLMRTLDGAKRLKLVILDACRNNPFAESMKRSAGTRALDRGLARVEPRSADTLIAYAARAGTVASDGDGANSPFAAALSKRLFEPGVDVELAFRRVRDDVLAQTGGVQEPFKYGSLGGDAIALSKLAAPAGGTGGATPLATGAPAADPCADAAAHWAQAQKLDRLEFYQDHLARFGQCAFAGFARARIEELGRVAAATPVEPAGAPAVPAGVTDCDRLASRPDDPGAVAPGVLFDQIDAARAFPACQSAVAAEPGEPRLMFELGRVYDKLGRDREAIDAYKKAADAGYTTAFVAIGLKYATGEGFEKNAAEAARWYKAAADKGDPAALFNLAMLYDAGSGVPKDPGEATRLLKLAVDRGSVNALGQLGFSYANGRGVPRDMAEAVRFYALAAAKGDIFAKHNLGALYDAGKGVARDPVEAATLIAAAVEGGYAFSLSQMTSNSNAYTPAFRAAFQTILIEKGLYAGPANGRFNAQTIAAIRKLAGRP